MTDSKAIENQSFKDKIKFSLRERLIAAAGIFTIFCGSLYVWFFNPTTQGFFPTCPLYSMTGFACPGCGLTRGFHALFHGDISHALGYNALLPIYAFVFLYLLIALFFITVRGRGLSVKIFHPVALGSFLVVALSFAVLRNLPIYPFTLLYP